MKKFIDRQHAGKVLAELLHEYANRADVIVLALPRGGIPIGYEIASSLSVPLNIVLVRKLGVPGHKELAMGAIASGDEVILNESLINQLQLDKTAIQPILQAEKIELKRREQSYCKNHPYPSLRDKTIILVDDGLATGATMRVAIASLRQHHPAAIIVAAPVAAQETYQTIAKAVNKIICPLQPLHFYAVGYWYDNFTQVSDEEVIALLDKSNEHFKQVKHDLF